MKAEIYEDENGFFIATVDGVEITKQNNMVQAAKKLYRYLVGQS